MEQTVLNQAMCRLAGTRGFWEQGSFSEEPSEVLSKLAGLQTLLTPPSLPTEQDLSHSSYLNSACVRQALGVCGLPGSHRGKTHWREPPANLGVSQIQPACGDFEHSVLQDGQAGVSC